MKMPMGAGRVVARSYIALALGVGPIWLELFTWGYVDVGRRCAVKILSKHGPDSTMCIDSHWSEDHLVVEKIADDR